MGKGLHHADIVLACECPTDLEKHAGELKEWRSEGGTHVHKTGTWEFLGIFLVG